MNEICSLALLLINAAGFLIMCLDKRAAIRKTRRVPEKTLLTLAALGGSAGVLLGMLLARHKIRKRKFQLLVPLFLLAQLLLWHLLKK